MTNEQNQNEVAEGRSDSEALLAADLITEPMELIEQVLRKFGLSIVEGLREEIAKKNKRIYELEAAYLDQKEELRELRGELQHNLGSTGS